MSVPVGKRQEGHLKVAVEALALAKYTLDITANKKIFKAEYQNALTDKIIEAALDIYLNIWEANNVYASDKSTFELRRRYQTIALANCNKLLALIDIAAPVFHLTSKRVKFWAGQAVSVKRLLRAWRDADNKRFNA